METRLHSRTWAKWSFGGGTGLRSMVMMVVSSRGVVVVGVPEGAWGRGLG